MVRVKTRACTRKGERDTSKGEGSRRSSQVLSQRSTRWKEKTAKGKKGAASLRSAQARAYTRTQPHKRAPNHTVRL